MWPPLRPSRPLRCEAEPVVEAERAASTSEPDEDEPVTVKSVETVSAIDLVMGALRTRTTESARGRAEDPASA